MRMQWSTKHVPPLGGYGLCILWEIKWYAREQCLFVLWYLIASSVFDEFCAYTGWVDTITGGSKEWPCWNCTNVDEERCQHWSRYQGIVDGKCILVYNSWMVAMWSGEHPLGLLAVYANEGGGRWSGHGRSLESWYTILKCHILNVLVLWRSCVTVFGGWKHRKRIGMQPQIKWICFECMKCICSWAVHQMGHP